jgi:hypothetical protein
MPTKRLEGKNITKKVTKVIPEHTFRPHSFQRWARNWLTEEFGPVRTSGVNYRVTLDLPEPPLRRIKIRVAALPCLPRMVGLPGLLAFGPDAS